MKWITTEYNIPTFQYKNRKLKSSVSESTHLLYATLAGLLHTAACSVGKHVHGPGKSATAVPKHEFSSNDVAC
jgi:hypothetical protein